MDELWAMQNQVFTTGEFNYEFSSDERSATGRWRLRSRNSPPTARPPIGHGGRHRSGRHRGESRRDARRGSASLADRWYSGYFRVATNEKGVVRSYLSTGDAAFGRQLEQRTRDLLEKEFGGQVID